MAKKSIVEKTKEIEKTEIVVNEMVVEESMVDNVDVEVNAVANAMAEFESASKIVSKAEASASKASVNALKAKSELKDAKANLRKAKCKLRAAEHDAEVKLRKTIPTRLTAKDKELLASRGIKIINNHSRLFASAEIDGKKIAFQIQYVDINGNLEKVMPDGSVQLASEYTVSQITSIMQGKPIFVDRITTSNVVKQNEVQMLQASISSFGKPYYTVSDVDSVFDANGKVDKAKAVFSDEVYENARNLSISLFSRSVK